MDTRHFTDQLNELQSLAELAAELGCTLSAGPVVCAYTAQDVARIAGDMEAFVQSQAAQIEALETEVARLRALRDAADDLHTLLEADTLPGDTDSIIALHTYEIAAAVVDGKPTGAPFDYALNAKGANHA